MIREVLEKKINSFYSERTMDQPRYILLDFQSFQILKEEVYQSVEFALELGLEEYEGLRVFYNDTLEQSFIEVV